MSNGEPPRRSLASQLLRIAGILLVHAFALFLVLMVYVKVVPTYAIFFEQQGVALPVATQRMVLFSDLCVAFWFIMYPLGMAVDTAVVLILALAASRKPWLASAYSHTCLLAALAAMFYVFSWLSHPVYSLVR